jgi:beta-lactamase regulating signal transducer with metallopeptidase domain
VTALAIWKTVFWIVVHGTVLAAIAWALSVTVLRRARPAVIAALWSVVLLKFLVPIGPAMPWSVSSWLDRLVATDAPVRSVATAPIAAAGAAPAAAPAGTPVLEGVAGVALVAWLGVAAVLIVRRLHAQRALRRRAGRFRRGDAETTAVVAAVARRIGLGRAPEVRIDDAGAVPWVIGLRRPVLVLPPGLAADELAAVIGHELAHLRRRDAWLRVVQVVAGSVFFFWPVVRWVNRRADAARELACDAWALSHGPLGPHAYARVLVRLVRRARAAPAPALALAAHPHLLGRRVDALLDGGRPIRAGVGVPGLAVLAGWTVLALGGASRAEAPAARSPSDCAFTPAIAASILAAYPHADADGDGTLTRAEACDFQLELLTLADNVSLPDELEGLRLQCPVNGDTSASPDLDPPNTCTQD